MKKGREEVSLFDFAYLGEGGRPMRVWRGWLCPSGGTSSGQRLVATRF